MNKVSMLDMELLSKIIDETISKAKEKGYNKEELELEKRDILRIFLKHKSRILKVYKEYTDKKKNKGEKHGTFK